jgi:membrane fusion protein (multidrug efflux system)
MLSLLRTGTLVLLGVSLLACSSEPKPAGKTKKPRPAQLVAAAKVESRPLAHASRLTGTLRAKSRVRIFNQEEGAILAIAIHEGDAVKQGDVLIEMDDKLLRAQYDKARANRRQARDDLDRQTKLRKRKLVSEEELNRAKTTFDVADAEEKLLSTRLGYTRIQATSDGIISQRLVEPGDVVPKHTHLLTLIDTSALLTEVSVSGLLLPALQIGGNVNVRIDALGDQMLSGRILRIHPALNATTRRGTVEIVLDDPPVGAIPGQLCRVTLQTTEQTRRVIPFIALRRDNQGEYVFRISKDNKVERAAIRSGLRIGDRVEILEGLQDGERVVMRGFLGLKPGTAVRTTDQKPVTNNNPTAG